MKLFIKNDKWNSILQETLRKREYFREFASELSELYETKTIYPDKDNLFKAFEYLNPEDVRVVILGQDPYHSTKKVSGEDIPKATGLAFSIPDGMAVTDSLKNIFIEAGVKDRIAKKKGALEGWCEQGVLLLNTVLTVESEKTGSHIGRGWEHFTDDVIKFLDQQKQPIVFMLWGDKAQRKRDLIIGKNNEILTASHPSPYFGAAEKTENPFISCNHFVRANKYLKEHARPPIDWKK
ncbi:uracil-DNA glycosylase [Planctomycetales bacterium]|nr:uracil-DNA glycosylase [Planctomycetales bacterium]